MDEDVADIKRIICVLYGNKKPSSINDARFQFFATSSNRKMLISQYRKSNVLMGVACHNVKTLRLRKQKSYFRVKKWMTLINAFQSSWSTANYGGKYKIKWCNGRRSTKIFG